jgi:hypothetical protein
LWILACDQSDGETGIIGKNGTNAHQYGIMESPHSMGEGQRLLAAKCQGFAAAGSDASVEALGISQRNEWSFLAEGEFRYPR